MGIFTRFRDIINSNINTMLEKAEDPEKLIKLMIQEMEDTLVELKASCAGAMANRTRIARKLEECRERATDWERKARLALQKEREDLAREALVEKQHFEEEIARCERELGEFVQIIEQYQKDIQQLEDKLDTARNKHRVLVERHIQANRRKRAQSQIRTAETSDAFLRFEQFESRVDRMQADADLINSGRERKLESEINRLEEDEAIEGELERLKREMRERKPKERSETTD